MKTRLFITAVAFITAVVMGSCAENSSSLVIIQNQPPSDGCEASNSVSDKFLSHGILDLGASRFGITPQYIGWFVVENNLRSTVDDKGIELNKVEITKAKIQFHPGQAGENLEYTQYGDYTFVTIAPGETRTLQVNLIPPNVAERLNVPEGQFIEAYVKLQIVGERGGTTIESNTIRYPITLCNGCLIKNIGYCDSATFPDPLAEGQSCNKSQDEPLDCCQDPNAQGADATYRCPAVKSEDNGGNTGETNNIEGI